MCSFRTCEGDDLLDALDVIFWSLKEFMMHAMRKYGD